MVSLVRLKKPLAIVAVVLVALAGVWTWRACRRTADLSARERLPEVVPDEIPRSPTLETLEPFLGKPVPKEMENELAAFFTQMTDAYTNRNYELVRAQIARVPEAFYSVSRSVFQGVLAPFCTAFMDEVLWKRGGFRESEPLPDFEDERELSIYLRVNTDAAMFLGRTFVRRKEWGPPLNFLESAALMQLGRYRRLYLQNGKDRHRQVVDRFTREWQRHIESEDGFTRQYMWSVVDWYVYAREHRELYWKRHRVDTWLSREEIFRIARDKAKGLIKYGYMPKWLDEFK